MKAAVFSASATDPTRSPKIFVQTQDVPCPALAPGHMLLRVLACGVCHSCSGCSPAAFAVRIFISWSGTCRRFVPR
jgi:hypothetical protein